MKPHYSSTFVLFVFLSFTGFSQESISSSERQNANGNKAYSLDPVYRYGKDYRLVDESLLGADSLILQSINVRTLDTFRKPKADHIITHKTLGVQILIFSEERALENGAPITYPLNRNSSNITE